MATNFPTSLDSLTNPTGASSLTSPDHAGQHTDANDAIEALQAKVGVNGSAVTTSLDYRVGVNTPAGMIVQFAGSSAPAGWLLCDGTAYSGILYPTLYAVIGTTYGAGGGAPNFNVPNLKGRVPVGRDAAQTAFDALGETGGASTHTLSSAEMPIHTHTQNAHNHGITDPGHVHNFNFGSGAGGGSIGYLISGVNLTYPSVLSNTTGITVNNQTATNQNTGGGQQHNNLQPYIVVNYIIKT
jgi:microcystin-dependent protein